MSEDRLYQLLPAIHRLRDAQSGQVLQALLGLIEAELNTIRAEIESGYDDAFVETADSEALVLIGQALGVGTAGDTRPSGFRQRSWIGNAVGWRRRKGTTGSLAPVARQVTGYAAVAVEHARALAVSAHVPLEQQRAGTASLRTTTLRPGGPFDPAPRTPDVRAMDGASVRPNLPHTAIFLWRTTRYGLEGAAATAMEVPGISAWHVSPFGVDAPMFAPAAEDGEGAVWERFPVPLTREELDAVVRGGGALPFALRVEGRDGADVPTVRAVAAAKVHICHLGEIELTPPAVPADEAWVDPASGRVVLGSSFEAGLTEAELLVDSPVASVAPVGAGPWDRQETVEAWLAGAPVTFQRVVRRRAVAVDGDASEVRSLQIAVQAWHDHLDAPPPGTPAEVAAWRASQVALILLGDSRHHDAPTMEVRVPRGARVAIVAGGWPRSDAPVGPRADGYDLGAFAASGLAPRVVGHLRFTPEGALDDGAADRVLVDGLHMKGGVRVTAGWLDAAQVSHCTIDDSVGLRVNTADGANSALEVDLLRSITTRVAVPGEIGRLRITESVVRQDVEAGSTRVDLQSVTVLGLTSAAILEASDCLLVGGVDVAQTQTGCLRFSWTPSTATPPRFRCQPDLALDGVTSASAVAVIRARVKPEFHSLQPGSSGFAVLRAETPVEVATASEDGGEPGVHHPLEHAARIANAVTLLEQHVRFGPSYGLYVLV